MAQDILQKAKECFKEAQEAFEPSRLRMVEDLKFSNPADPEQWDEAVRRAREQSTDGSRPCLTFDQTNQYIAQVVNDSRQNKPSIKVLPVDSGADVQVADRLEGMIRHIEYSSRAGIAYDTAIEYAARVGLGWLRVVPEIVNPELNEQEIRIKRVHDPLSVIIDPNATEPDGSDAAYGFVTTMMTKKAFQAAHPKVAAESWPANGSDGWFNEDSLRICEYFYKEESKQNHIVIDGPDGAPMTLTEDDYWQLSQATGMKPPIKSTFDSVSTTVKWVKMTGCEVLEETDFPSIYIPLVPVLGYELWVEGRRYLCGMVRRMMDPQRAYNYERTSYIESVALQTKAPWTVPWEAMEQFQDEWSRANTANLAYLPYNAVDSGGNPLPAPQRNSPPTIPTAFIQGAATAINDIQASIGMYKSNLGAQSNAVSGRAKMQDQREGDTANFHYIDNMSRGIEQLGRIIVNMIPQVYDTKRIARICGDDGTNDFVQVDPEQQQAFNKAKDAAGKTVVTINPNVGTYDVRVKAGPSYSTMRQESAEGIAQVLQGNPQAFAVLGPEWAKMQEWPNAEKVSKLLMAMAPPAVQQIEQGDSDIPPQVAGQMQQQKQQIEQLQAALQDAHQKIESGSVEAMAKLADSDKDRAIEYYKAETERLKVTAPAFGPGQIQAIVMQTLQQVLSTPMPDQRPTQMPQPPQMQPPPQQPPMPPGPPQGPPGAPPGMPPGMPPPQFQPQPPQGGFSLPVA